MNDRSGYGMSGDKPVGKRFNTDEIFRMGFVGGIKLVAREIGAPDPYITLKPNGSADKYCFESMKEYDFELEFYPTERITGSDLGLEMFGDKIIRQLPGIPGAKSASILTSKTDRENSVVMIQGLYTGDLTKLTECLIVHGYEHDPAFEIKSSEVNLRGKESQEKR